MKVKLPNKFTQNSYVILRKCGYLPIHDRKSGKDSFSRKISSGHYPRFHLYLSELSGELLFDLHLDQNPNRYQGQTAHNADYDSDEVQTELGRIYASFKQYQISQPTPASETTPSPQETKKPAPKKSWLKKIFG